MIEEKSDKRELGESELGLAAFLEVVWRRRTLIVALCVSASAATAGVTLTMQRIYESTATILAPREGAGGGLLGSLATSALLQQIPILSTPSLTPNRDMLVGVLKSRTVAEFAVDAFRLQDRYRSRYKEDAIRELRAKTEIGVTREGVITVKVEDTDAALAAQIANSFVTQLDRLISQYGVGDASRQRVFMTTQLARARTDLETAEESLRKFQERNRAVVLQEQTRGAIEGAARLKGEIMAAEVQIQVMRDFATEANPEVVSLRRRIDELRRQLAGMQYGDETSLSGASKRSGDRADIFVPVVRVPEVGLELARLTREMKIQETLVNLLVQQVEQARIAEAKDLPVVQVLDRAVAAERYSRPRLLLNVAVSGAISLLVGVFIAIFSDGWKAKYRDNTRTT